MAVAFEKFPSGGGAAFLTGRRDGPALIWFNSGEFPRFGFNRPGGPITAIDNARRFGPVPHTWAEFQRYARAFEAGDESSGLRRSRPGHPKGRGSRIGIVARLSRRNGRRRYRGR